MQNKINQKVPIAKMDELIAAIKENGGGGSKLYLHNVKLTYQFMSTDVYAYVKYISADNIQVTDMSEFITGLRGSYAVNDKSSLQVSPSAAYTSIGFLSTDVHTGFAYWDNTKVAFQEVTFVDDTVTEL